MKTKFATVKEAVRDIRDGKCVIVVDDEGRENEGDVVCAAERVSAGAINFMAKYARGLICMPIEGKRLDELKIGQMVATDPSSMDTAFTVSIDAKDSAVTTGISAQDRAITIKKVLHPDTKPEDFNRPGHVFPLRAKEGGVLIRAGHTEASVDLARLAGLYPAGVVCEIMNEDGTMARMPELLKFAGRHRLKVLTIADLIAHLRKTEKFVRRVAEVNFPTVFGDFHLVAYENTLDHITHIALVKGDLKKVKEPLVRVHSECLTGEVFKSKKCDCGEQLEKAMQLIAEGKGGALLYIREEGRGIGLLNKIKAYQLQDQGKDTVEANMALGFAPDLRDYGTGAQILVDLGVKRMKLLTNNPRKIVGIEGHGLKVTERIPLQVQPNALNIRYLKAKKEKLGHLIDIKEKAEKRKSS